MPRRLPRGSEQDLSSREREDMRKLTTLAAAAGAGLVLTLIASTPSIAQNVDLNGGSKAEPTLRHDGGTDGNDRTHGTLVKFRGGIGVQPLSPVNGQAPVGDTVNPNLVPGVQPPRQPWV